MKCVVCNGPNIVIREVEEEVREFKLTKVTLSKV